ncbi:hypothetical protein V1478_015766 [Vespula squamosa]|uniref:Uncharacterized protein n=1 Tax=Vespula squamosa TaxID=30214 RepID=A0ABD2A1S8_VESSQ
MEGRQPQNLNNKNRNCCKLKNIEDRYLDQSTDIPQIFIKIDELRYIDDEFISRCRIVIVSENTFYLLKNSKK